MEFAICIDSIQVELSSGSVNDTRPTLAEFAPLFPCCRYAGFTIDDGVESPPATPIDGDLFRITGGEPVVAEEGAGRIWRQAEIEIPGPGLDALERMLADPSGFYLNVHTESRRPGLLRGQLRAVNADLISDLQAEIAALRGQQEADATILRRIGLAHGVVRRGE